MILTRIEIRMRDSAWSCRQCSSLLSRPSAILKSGLTAKLCLWLSVWERKKRWQMADWIGRVGDVQPIKEAVARARRRHWARRYLFRSHTSRPAALRRSVMDFNFHHVWIDSSSRLFSSGHQSGRCLKRGEKPSQHWFVLCLKVDFIVFLRFHTSLGDTLLGTFSKDNHHLQFILFECRQLHLRSLSF